MTIAADTVLRVVAQFLWVDGEVNQNVFNAKVSGAGAPWADQDIIDDAEAWLDNMYLNILSNMSDRIDGNQVLVYKYDAVGDDWDEVGTQAFTYNPTSATEYLPRGNAALINLKTTDPDVSGKKYIPGLVEGSVTDGLLGSSFVVNLAALAADWLTAFVGGTSGASWTPGIWSVVGKTFLPAIDHFVIPTIVAYQRRRKDNVGI